MIKPDYAEEMMIAIQNDDIDNFLVLIEKFPNWENHYLKDEEQYLSHYAAS